MFVIGGREAEQNEVAVRKHGSGDQGTQTVDAAIAMLTREIATKGLEQSGNV
jgi:threonyl-tRNA synthetase